jgi:hypothetical protein
LLSPDRSTLAAVVAAGNLSIGIMAYGGDALLKADAMEEKGERARMVFPLLLLLLLTFPHYLSTLFITPVFGVEVFHVGSSFF